MASIHVLVAAVWSDFLSAGGTPAKFAHSDFDCHQQAYLAGRLDSYNLVLKNFGMPYYLADDDGNLFAVESEGREGGTLRWGRVR